ncbi:MAG: diguanylate cyclase domain-containing protein [Roseburia sp.]
MRKGNIVVFLGGWNSEFQTRIVNGILQKAHEEEYSVSIFTCQTGVELMEMYFLGEKKIFTLPDLKKFDGAILIANTIWEKPQKDYIVAKIRESGIPAVTLEEKYDGMGYVGISNYHAMQKVFQYIKENFSHCRRICYMAGPDGNMEDAERKQAFLDYLREEGLDPRVCPVLPGEYSSERAQVQVRRLIERGEVIPDFFVCANDQMAFGVCAELKKQGYRVGEDVYVTGFDGIKDVSRCVPTITTIDRPKEELGRTGCELLLRQMAGEPAQSLEAEATLMLGGSTDLKINQHQDAERIIEEMYLERQNYEAFSWLVRAMDDEMMECETLPELIFCMRQSLQKITPEHIYLCLNKTVYQEMTGLNRAKLLNQGKITEYEDQIYMTPINKAEGMPEFESFHKEELFPDMWQEHCTGKENYIFVPVHFKDNCLGYLVITGEVNTATMPRYYSWVRNMCNSIENLRNILSLKTALRNIDNLSMQDTLTGVYNRTGINRFVVDMVEQANHTHRQLLFIFGDMDCLKFINDVYGHEAGDQAICLVADALRLVFGKDQVIIRYGGDEFLIVTEDYSADEMEDKEQQVSSLLEKWKAQEKLEYPLSISIGYFQKTPDMEETMEKYIDHADEAMYQVKVKRRVNRTE